MLCHRVEQLHELVQTPHNMLRRLEGFGRSGGLRDGVGAIVGGDKAAAKRKVAALAATLRPMCAALTRQSVRVAAAIDATLEMTARLLETTREMRASGVAPDPPSATAEAETETEAVAAEATEAGAAASELASESNDGAAADAARGDTAQGDANTGQQETRAAASAHAAASAVEDALRVRLASIAPHHRGSHVSQSHELPTRLRTTRARERNRDRGNGDDATGPSAWACILCCEWNAEVS